MAHIDENTLELFVLGDEKTRKRGKQIKRHLAACRGCSNLYQEIRSFYEEVEREGKSAVSPLPRMAERSLVRKRNELEPYFLKPEAQVVPATEVRPPSVWRQMNRFRREHPVRSTIGMFAIAAALAAGAGYLWRGTVPDWNPAYVQVNTGKKAIDVFNSGNHQLWSLPILHAGDLEYYEAHYKAAETIVADLDGTGTNEVITAVPLPGDNSSSPLRVYNGRGDLVGSRAFDDSDVTFAGEHYYSPFQPSFLISDRMADGSSNLFVFVCNGRSPCYLARLGPNLRVIGKYWHYGNFSPYLSAVAHNGIRDIIITGVDDMGEMSGDKFEFVAILDPTKIVGNEESAETPGFGLGRSTAEIYYIKLPKSSIEWAAALGGRVRVDGYVGKKILEVQQASPLPSTATGYWGFNFVFSTNDMALQSVKYNDPTPETFQLLKKEGKLSGNFDRQYLENLKEGVRYWSGKKWVKTPTRIEHLSDSPGQKGSTP